MECQNCGSRHLRLSTIGSRQCVVVCMNCGHNVFEFGKIRHRFYRGDVVTHFKGTYYEILYPRAKCCTNGQEGYVVIYKKYGVEKSPVYVRDYDEFMSKVDFDKYPDAKQEYRFEFCFNVDDGA